MLNIIQSILGQVILVLKKIKQIQLIKNRINNNDTIYIATDIKNIKLDNDFSYFYKNINNIYTIDNFDINIKKEFIPFIDILVCSKSSYFYYALEYSTFSRYIEKIWKVNHS